MIIGGIQEKKGANSFQLLFYRGSKPTPGTITNDLAYTLMVEVEAPSSTEKDLEQSLATH